MKEKRCFKKLSIMWMKLFLIFILFLGGNQQVYSQSPVITKATQQCLNCHKKANPGLVAQWENSVHYKMAVGCYECHQATQGDTDAFIHSEPETYISTIVSPKDCSKCHMQEVREFSQSAHSDAYALVVNPTGALVGEFLFGNNDLKTVGFPHGASAAKVNGCWKCHGCEVKLSKTDKQVKLDPATWPNTGIGRINPDGSRGSCSACHSGHEFSVAQARQPESCGVCHSGDASTFEYEIYAQSKHGVN